MIDVDTPESELEELLRDADAEIEYREREADSVRQRRTYLAALLAQVRFRRDQTIVTAPYSDFDDRGYIGEIAR